MTHLSPEIKPANENPETSNGAPSLAESSDPNRRHDNNDEYDLVGAVLGDRYRILKKLGSGGMGTVYLAAHIAIGKKLAVKVLNRQHARKTDLVRRFLQEAQASSMITQENVVEITDFAETPDGSVFIAMEYLHGEDLSETIDREQGLEWSRAQTIMLQICAALQAAHEVGVIHRDMKPENCFRIQRGENSDFVKVLDFGIAKVIGDSNDKNLTQIGMIFGTPEYMSPEQARGEAVDLRTDIYAAGVILFELLTGQVPFRSETPVGTLTKHILDVPDTPSLRAPNAAIPPEAEAVVLKALQKDPNLRFQTMAEMSAAIRAAGTGAPPGVEFTESSAITRSHRAIVLTADSSRSVPGPASSAPVEIPAPIEATMQTQPPPAIDQPEQVKPAVPLETLEPLETLAKAPQTNELAENDSIDHFGLSGQKRRRRVAIALGALVAIGLSYLTLSTDRSTPKSTSSGTPLAITTYGPRPVAGTSESSSTTGTEAEQSLVSIHFVTNVPATIIDGSDGAIRGKTNSPEGFELETSDDPHRLILRADGYTDLAVEVVPNQEGRYNKTLKKKRYKRSRSRSRSRKKRAREMSGSEPAPSVMDEGFPAVAPAVAPTAMQVEPSASPAVGEPAPVQQSKARPLIDFPAHTGDIKNPFD